MDFRSDNVSGVDARILSALAEASRGSDAAYGADQVTARLQRRFSALFEREVAVLPVGTGTAANALALSLYTPPWGAIYCHAHAHVHVDECGAPELFTGGAKLVPIEGRDGKLTPDALARALRGKGIVHAVQPAAVSVSQAAESGVVYSPDELRALSAVSRAHGLALHMDGARLANAIVSLDVTPAALTWRVGVDVLSFGATKNGAFAAEAVVLFDPARAEELGYRRKRAGHLLSKQRLLSAQLEAYVQGDLWLDNARHANTMASRLARGLREAGHAPLLPVEANELFVPLPDEHASRLRAAGFLFLDWPPLGERVRRFVTSFETRAEDVDALVRALG